MKRFISFPSIEQYRNIVHDIEHTSAYVGIDENGNAIMDCSRPKPILTFTGTVKLHGTNASVCYDGTELWAQSRNNIITFENDNAGFASFVHKNTDVFEEFFKGIIKKYNIDMTCNIISIHGEFCGGNIQKGIAINGLEKMFVIFGVKISPNNPSNQSNSKISAYWVDHGFDVSVAHGNIIFLSEGSRNIWNIEDFKIYSITIDFNNPKGAQNELIRLTEEVEAECPVGKDFGVKGIGEGIVWTHTLKDGSRYVFKVKGEKHSSSKVKKLATVDIEKINSVKEFVTYAVTENRLNQGVEQVFTINNKQIDIKDTGIFLKWVVSDIFKEERDTLAANNLTSKDVSGEISKVARNWLLKQI